MLEQIKHEPTGAVLPHGVALLRDPMLNKGTAFSERGVNAGFAWPVALPMFFLWKCRHSA